MSETLRVINDEGPQSFVERVVPVAPVTVTREASHPGIGGKHRAEVLWLVKDGTGKTLGTYYAKNLANCKADDARMVIAQNDFLAARDMNKDNPPDGFPPTAEEEPEP